MDAIQRKRYSHSFQGLYGYIGLRLIGFGFIVLSQFTIMVFITLAATILSQGNTDIFEMINFNILVYLLDLGNVGKPIIMCSLFILVIKKSNNIFKLLIMYAVLAFVFYIGEVVIFEHILFPFMWFILGKYSIPTEFLSSLEPMFETYMLSFSNLNVFLDMTLCVLFYIFIWYTPKTMKKKNIKYFRMLVIIPILYIVCSYTISVLSSYKIIQTNSIYISALLVKGSIPSFLIFVSCLIFMRIKRRIYNKRNNDLPFEEFVKTTHYSFSYSVFLAIVLAILSILEFIISFHPGIKAFSFAGNYFLFLAIPFILLCNLNLEPKRTNYRYIVPSWMLVHYSLFVISILWLAIKVLEFLELLFI